MTINAGMLQGSLSEFNLVDLLQMLEMGGTTGAIRLKQPPPEGRVGILYFLNGKIANCSELDAGALTLGEVLQQLGMATSQQIETAFAQQLLDPFGKRIGERLIATGVISEQQLREALRTKALWTARELALWKQGSYEFIPNAEGQNMLPYRETPLDLEIMPVIMEMIRYIDEWSRLGPYLPQGIRTTLYMRQNLPQAYSFDLRTLDLFLQVNLFRQVRRIAAAVRRPEMEVARDLAQLVSLGYLVPFYQPGTHAKNGGGNGVSLPAPAERLRMEDFQMFDLISRMEQDWTKRRTPMEQLPGLAEYTNWTMDALADTCREKHVTLDPNTLIMLLYRENLRYMGNYEFKVFQNHIDVENFTALCYEVLGSDFQKSKLFFEEGSRVLQNILRKVFEMINARIASLEDRMENEAIWETLLKQLEQDMIR